MKTKLRAVITAALITGLLPGTLAGCSSRKTEAAPPDSKEEERVIAPRSADDDLLLLVDFQKVYLPGYDWACPSMPEALQNTIRILDAAGAPACIMTRFVAPADPVGRWQQYNKAYREINENPVLAELADVLAPYAEKTTVIDKSTYSSMQQQFFRLTGGLLGCYAVFLIINPIIKSVVMMFLIIIFSSSLSLASFLGLIDKHS